MGEQVATVYNASKQDMVRSTVAAGALVPGAGELVVWVGDNPVNQLQVRQRIAGCFDALRERGVPVDQAVAGARNNVASGGASTVEFFQGGATPALAEDEVAVFYQQTFANGYGASTELWEGMVKRAREKLIEEFYKVR